MVLSTPNEGIMRFWCGGGKLWKKVEKKTWKKIWKIQKDFVLFLEKLCTFLFNVNPRVLWLLACIWT